MIHSLAFECLYYRIMDNINQQQSAHIATQYKPSGAFVGVSWLALGVGMLAFVTGLWNANFQLNEKGYYFTVLCYGLFSAVSVQKSVRDRLEGIPVSNMYYGLAWLSVMLSLLLLSVGLWNAKLLDSEKGFYAVSFLLSLFGAIAVQKNVRDLQSYDAMHPKTRPLKPASEANKPTL
jgi:uncharacterized membrane protein YiaA